MALDTAARGGSGGEFYRAVYPLSAIEKKFGISWDSVALCSTGRAFGDEIVVRHWHDVRMGTVINLLDRRVYGIAQVDRILGLTSGTARRWIDGYKRGGREFAPVVRPSATRDETVTWGEFIETRLLAEYRDAGVPLIRMRPAIVRLREELGTLYPLASAKAWLRPEGRELIGQIQDEVGLERRLRIVIRNGQGLFDWSEQALDFQRSAQWTGSGVDAELRAIRPVSAIQDVLIDPLRSFGEPVVRGVRTDVIAELVRAGDTPDMIAELYELPRALIDAAVRYELQRAASAN